MIEERNQPWKGTDMAHYRVWTVDTKPEQGKVVAAKSSIEARQTCANAWGIPLGRMMARREDEMQQPAPPSATKQPVDLGNDYSARLEKNSAGRDLLHIYYRGKIQDTFSPTQVDRLRALIARKAEGRQP